MIERASYDRHMPVLVTPVASDLSRRLVDRLLDEGGQVRAVARDHIAELRAAGAMVATADPDDPGRLEAAMTQVHTVVHVPDLLLARSAQALEHEAGAVVAAAEGAGVRRVILRSVVGAREDAAEPLRRLLGRVERRFAEAGLPTIVVRTGMVDEVELRAVLSGTPLPPDLRERSVGLIPVAAIVEVLARLDAARSTAEQGHVVFTATAAPITVRPLGDSVSTWAAAGRAAVYLDATSAPLLHAALAGDWIAPDGEATLDAWGFTGVDPCGAELAAEVDS